MLGIESYIPKFYDKSTELLNENKELLTSLIGKTITEIWCVWDKDSDEFFSSCPVVIVIDGVQVELCCNKLDEFSVTFDTVDMNEDFDWYGTGAFDLEWRNDIFRAFDEIKGKEVTSIEIIEGMPYGESSSFEKEDTWYMNGIGFEFGDKYISISNNLDENIVKFSKIEGNDLRVTKLYM